MSREGTTAWAKIVPDNLFAFPPSMAVMTGGRVTQDDSMDGIGRVESGTETEQLPRTPGATRGWIRHSFLLIRVKGGFSAILDFLS